MEEEKVTKKEQNSRDKKVDKWFAGYIVAGLIWYFAQGFKETVIDEFVVIIIAVGAGIFYHRLKEKIKIKNEVLKIAITFILLEVISGFLIGVLTSVL